MAGPFDPDRWEYQQVPVASACTPVVVTHFETRTDIEYSAPKGQAGERGR